MPTWLGGQGRVMGQPSAPPTFGAEFSVHLNGSSYYHRAASANGVTSAWSVSGWFKPTALTGTQRLFTLGTLTSANRITIALVGGDPATLRLNIAGTLGGAGITTDYSAAIVEDTWYHLLLTKQGGGTYALYLNGVAQSSPGGPATMGNTSRAVTLGQSPSFTAGEGFVGRVGHWAIWGSRVLDLFEGTDVAAWLYGEAFNVDLSVGHSPDYAATSAANLDHYWRPAYADLGFTDEGPDLGGLDLNASVGIDAGSVVHDFPGFVGGGEDNARSVFLDSSVPDVLGNITTLAPFGVANSWSVSIWAKPIFTGAGTRDLCDFDDPDSSVARIRAAFIDLGDSVPSEFAILLEDDAGTPFKSYRYDAALNPTSTWQNWLFTWDGTSLLLYYNGALTAPSTLTIDDPGTMDDAANRFVSIFGRLTSGPALQNTYDGHGGHVGVWSAVLDANDASQIAADGHTIDLTVNTGTYDKAASLVHYWPMGRFDLPEGLDDYAGTRSLDDSTILQANIVTDAP